MQSQSFHMAVSESNWRDPDLSVLDQRRGPVPAVPLTIVPQPWRDWIADSERATGAPADYLLQSVLAAVAAVCGAGVRIRVTPAWDEPLVLWMAAVGEASTGKSAALAPMLRLLETVEQERQPVADRASGRHPGTAGLDRRQSRAAGRDRQGAGRGRRSAVA